MSTPDELMIVLHHYVSPDPWPHGETRAYESDTDHLIGNGILTRQTGKVTLTERGRAWVRAIQSVAYPTSRTEAL
jgi:hypothetical protein